MATLALPNPSALVSTGEALSFGTGTAAANGSELHGQDFKALHQLMIGFRKRNAELAEHLVATEPADDFSYNTPPPLRSFCVEAVFVRGGEILPVPFDIGDD